MRQIKSFINDAAIQEAVDNKTLGKPYVALNESAGTIDWNGKNSKLGTPLTFDILTDGYINIRLQAPRTIDYSKNNADWVTLASNGQIQVLAGDSVSFRNSTPQYNYSTLKPFSGTTCQFNLRGNIMSLQDPTNFKDLDTISNNDQFSSLFANCSTLIDAENLILPATTLKPGCYSGLFNFCINLTKAPELPATTLANSCYSNMFTYNTKINYVKCLATDISAHLATYGWFNGANSKGTFVKKAGVTWPTGSNGIPSGWTVIEEE